MRGWIAVAAAVLLGACAATGVKVDQSKLQQFQKGKTTYQEIVQALGRPTSTTVTSSGIRFASYVYAESRVRPETLIPYIGPFVGGADAKATSVQFQFDANGILLSYTASESQFGTGLGAAAVTEGNRVENQPRNEPTAANAPTASPTSNQAPKPPPLGITGKPLTPEMAAAFQVPTGQAVMVLTITRGGVADAAGLRVGDMILSIGGVPTGSIEEANAAIAASAGSTVNAHVWRGHKEITVELTFPATT